MKPGTRWVRPGRLEVGMTLRFALGDATILEILRYRISDDVPLPRNASRLRYDVATRRHSDGDRVTHQGVHPSENFSVVNEEPSQ